MGRLTTHVLDTAQGCPGAGMKLALFRLDSVGRALIHTARTNADGRCDGPLLEGADFLPGEYELVFQAGAYFKTRSMVLPEPPFLNEVVLRFGIADPEQHYHVPLLISPWSYSTYRGS
jgi:5-hydroxyisourate hydrolase